MLYPVIISGSTFWRNLDHSNNSFDSSLKEITCEPAILEQVLSVKIFRMKGFDSPVRNADQLLTVTIGCILVITLSSYHISNLDYWILVGLREDALPTRALDIKTEYPERSNLRPFAFRRMRYELVPSVPL